MDVSKLKWGALPSPPDERDYKFEDIIAGTGALPSQYKNPYLEEINKIVLDQNTTAECVCCTVAHWKWLMERKQNGNKDMFSPSYLYGNFHDNDVDEGGCYPRCVCAQHVDYGICKFDDFPKWYNDKRLANVEYRERKAELNEKAYPYRSNMYYTCGTNLDTIKRGIMLRGGVMINVPVCDTLFDMVTPITKAPSNPKLIYGYHAMLAVGWDDARSCWIVLNSYGRTYNDIELGASKKNGYFYLSYNYPIVETYTFVDDINEVRKEEEEMFKDINGHWAQSVIEKYANAGFVNGYEDGTFRPDEPMTRAEVLTLIDRIREADNK